MKKYRKAKRTNVVVNFAEQLLKKGYKIEDDRAEDTSFLELPIDHVSNYAVVALDSFLSGWKGTGIENSYAAWLLPEDDAETATKIVNWVSSRGDMEKITIVPNIYRWIPTSPMKQEVDHLHIYTVGKGHPALNK